MNKVSAQQIRSLELRIARLEKEAGFIDDMVGVFKKTLNIPKNMFLKILYAFKEVYDDVVVWNTESESKAMDSLGALLGIRIFRSLAGVITTSEGLPKIVKFNYSDPLSSTFTGGLAMKSNIPLKKLINMYEGENQTRMKRAYTSWYADYKEIINPSVSDREAIDIFLDLCKRGGKWLYRLMTALIGLVGIATLKSTVIFNIIIMVVQRYVQIGMFDFRNMDKRILDFQETTVKYIDIKSVKYLEAEGVIENTHKFISDVLVGGRGYVPRKEVKEFTLAIVEKPLQKYQPIDFVSWKKVREYMTQNYTTFIGVFLTGFLALLEKALYKWVFKTEDYEKMKAESDAMGKTASKYPAIAYMARKLESYL